MTRADQQADFSTLRLSAYTWENGDYQAVRQNLVWDIRAIEAFSQHTAYPTTDHSTQAQPIFNLCPGVYTLEVSCDLGEHTVENVVLHPGAVIDEVVYFGKVGMDDGEESFDLSDDQAFDASSEYLRRLDEREGQRAFGTNADALRNPDILPPAEPGHEYDQSVEANSNFKSHPLLAQAQQFDGISRNMNADTSRSQHAAEAQLQPDLAPGAQPTASPATPTPSPDRDCK